MYKCQCMNVKFIFFINDCTYSLKEIFEFASLYRIDIRNNFVKINNLFCKINTGQIYLATKGESLILHLFLP